jgi:hypothetical protein
MEAGERPHGEKDRILGEVPLSPSPGRSEGGVGWAYGVLAVCLLVLVSRYATTPVGAVALLVALGLGYWRRELALLLLFSSAFLPYVWGLPFTAGYAVIALLAPLALWEVRFCWGKLPFAGVVFGALLLGVLLLTYPFSLPIDGLLLLAGVTGMLEAIVFSRGVSERTRVELGFFMVLLVVVFFPLAMNSLLAFYSPFWFPRHQYLFNIGRFTVGVLDPNVIAGYASASWAVFLFCARLRRRRVFRNAGIVFLGMFLIYILDSTGSRSALVVGIGMLMLVWALSLVSPRVRWGGEGVCWESMRFLTSVFLLVALTVGIINVMTEGKVFPGVTRLRETPGLEETGRPKSFRDALPYLDGFPLVGYDLREYVRKVSSHTPHMNVAAGVLFLGVPVAMVLYGLLMFPVVNLFLGLRFMPSLGLSLGIAVFLLTTLALPVTSERGLMVLLGTWLGFSRLPTMRDVRSASRALAVGEKHR